MKPKHNFRSIKDATFDAILPPNADPERAGLIAAGNPHVIAEAHGLEPYARKRKRGGRVKHAISGAHVRHRLDRRSRRKFASGGDANALPYGGKGYVPVMGPPPVSTSNIVNWWRIPRDPPPQQDPMQPIREAASMGLFKKKESDGDGDTTPSPPTGGVPLAGLDSRELWPDWVWRLSWRAARWT